MTSTLIGSLLGVVLGAVGLFLLRRRALKTGTPPLRVALVALAAVALAWACHFAELTLWRWTELSLIASKGKEAESLAAMFLFAAPLEEGAKVLALWPLYTTQRIAHARQATTLAAAVGFAFGATEIGLVIALGDASWLGALRALATLPAHVLSAIVWGAWLGTHTRAGWFSLAWLVAMLLRAAFDHVMLGRGAGLMILAAPLLLTLLALAYAVTRRAALEPGLALPPFEPQAAERVGAGSEPPLVNALWRALEPSKQPVMVPWIFLGALVTLGVGLSALAAAIYIGHRIGLDFALADEADLATNGPLLLLALALGAAFPAAGYLVARASGSRSVLEPALGAALAALAAVLFLSVTTSIAAIFAFAVTPVAFVLACTGAWFGITAR